jgi:hypothetical protein
VYIQKNAYKEEITYSSVEEYAISHYKSEGYIEGNHILSSIHFALYYEMAIFEKNMV